MEGAAFDVFLSHAWADGDRPRQIADALSAEGLRVWFDAAEINDFDSITRAVNNGLTRSKALLVYYSKTYPTRRACQFELTAAFLAAQGEGDPGRRVLVVSPEKEVSHIHPIELRDAKFRAAPEGAAGLADLVAAVVKHVSGLSGPFVGIQAAPTPPWYGIEPVRYPRFVGRFPEMWEIHSALQEAAVAQVSGAAGKTVVLLTGLGGNGKSLLTREYAIRFGAAYPGGVFWLRAHGGEEERTSQVRGFAQALGIAVEGRPQGEIEHALRAALAARKEPLLWIVDDLPPEAGPAAFAAWSAPGPHRTLITTRSRTYENLGSARAVNLGELANDDAYALLASHRQPGEADVEAARGIVLDLGFHPLAVDISGARLARSRGFQSFAGFRRELEREDRDALELAAQLAYELPIGHEKSIAHTLLSSIRSLGPEGLDFLRLASVLGPGPISPPLIRGAFGRSDGLSSSAAADTSLVAVAQAEDLCLCERKEDEEGSVSVHTLVSRTVRFHQQGSGERVRALRSAAIEALIDGLSFAAPDARTHGAIEWYAAHARHLSGVPSSPPEADLLGWVARCDDERGAFSSSRELFSRVAEFRRHHQGADNPDTLISFSNTANALKNEGRVAEARALLEDVLERTRRVRGPEHPDTLNVMHSLASAYRLQGNLAEALALNRKTYELRLGLLGPDHEQTLTTMDNFAGTLADTGDLNEAVRLRREVVAGFRRVLGPDHRHTMTAMSNLANMFHAQRDFDEARKLHQHTLAIRRRVLGPRHPDTLASMNGLAMTLRSLDELDSARALQEETLLLMREILGPEHPETLTNRNNLGVTLHSLGEYTAARKLHEECLETSRRTLGLEHPFSLQSMLNLSDTLHRLGQPAEARRLQEEAFAISLRVYGSADQITLSAMQLIARTLHSQGEGDRATQMNRDLLALRQKIAPEQADTMAAMLTLSEALERQGDWRAALELRQREMQLCARVMGPEHRLTLISANNLALMFGRHGNWLAAYQLDLQTCEARQRALGPEHEHTLVSMNSIAIDLRRLGLTEEAVHLHRRTLELRRRVVGEEHPHTLESRNNLASTLGDLQEWEEARALDEETLAIRRRVLGPEHPDTLQSMNNLATVLRQMGHVAEARRLHEETLAIRRRVLGPEHPETLTSMSNLGWAMHKQGDFAGARQLGEDVLALRRRVLGPAHPDTMSSMNNLAPTMEALGETARAAELREEVHRLRGRG